MKPTPTSPPELAPLLAFGAHPDDIEFSIGGIVAQEVALGRRVHFVVCSRGEAGTHGSPALRTKEAKKAAEILGASIEFMRLDGDAHLEIKARHAIKLAAVIRRIRPVVIVAPTVVPTQHPDHWRLGTLVRDAARLARFGGMKELRKNPPHAIGQLFFYALSPNAEPTGVTPVIVDISRAHIVTSWKSAMEAHASQMKTRNYLELQLARARMHGLASGVGHAQLLFPDAPIVFESLAAISRAAQRF
ncbi:MAG: LmbE family protein [Verrucomicrobia bacterium]|nr:LmbE family protein [Verrucomicrobiota bacterium]